MAALRGLGAFFLELFAGRMARLTTSPLGLGFFCGGLLAAARLFFFRRSLSSSSSGSSSLLSDGESSEEGASLSASFSFASRRFRFALRAGLVAGVNFSGFLETRPDLRRGADGVTSPASDDKTAALMVSAQF